MKDIYNHKVELSGFDTATLPVLTETEKSGLLRTIHTGGEKAAAARERMISGNLRLVLSVVQKFAGRTADPDDLFQVGCIGLMKAIDNFDTSQGVRFSTYGVPMIVGEIRRFLRDNTPLRVSRSMRDLAYRALQVRDQLQKNTAGEPSHRQIAEILGVKESDVTTALESISEPLSLFEAVYSEGNDTVCVMDQIGDANGEDNWIFSILFRQTVNDMSQREKNILSQRYLQGKTQTDVAREIGISQAQVSRLEKNALKKIDTVLH